MCKKMNLKYLCAFVLIIALVFLVVSRLGSWSGFADHSSVTKSSQDSSAGKSALSSRDLSVTKSRRSPGGDIQDLRIEDLPLNIDDWELPEDDLKIFSQLSEQFEEREVLRIIHKGHGYESYVDEAGETHGVLQESSVIRPPEPDERDEILDDLREALLMSSASMMQRNLIRMFFEERFSLNEDDFKILTTNAIGSADGLQISRAISVRLANSLFIEKNESGEEYIRVRGRSRAESAYTNPSSQRAERYGHLVDPEAGE